MSDFLFAFKLRYQQHRSHLKVHILFCIMFGVAVLYWSAVAESLSLNVENQNDLNVKRQNVLTMDIRMSNFKMIRMLNVKTVLTFHI